MSCDLVLNEIHKLSGNFPQSLITSKPINYQVFCFSRLEIVAAYGLEGWIQKGAHLSDV